ncbi:MAG: hypothetical protein Q7J25_13540 [Vicinamibacterales bacterium]|nr:hypothetical protein [Vicinamibacterales bacterium]
MNDSRLSEELKNGIERIVLLPVRMRHRRGARAKRKARTDSLRTVRHTLRGAAQLGAGSATTVFNVGLYLLLLDQDIAYFTDDLVCAIGDRRRAFLAKHEAVLLYEAAEDLPQLLGREFRDAINALGASADQVARLNSVSSDLNQFWQGHREFLGTIRNALAAHRDHDALGYADALETLKPLEVMGRAAQLSQLLERLVRVITEMASLTVGPSAIIRDMIASSKRGKAG